MRQLRRGAPVGWLLALLLPLLVPGGPSGDTVTALLRHSTVTAVTAQHQPLSRQAAPGGRQHDFTAPLTGVAAGAGGCHPVGAPPPDARHPSLAAGLDSRAAGGGSPRPLSALLVRPGRAPPSTGV
ncbi:hypothetical protein [Streptosporangium sp. NPDC006007]|uniref:hypothetical protein n=1 Tax=Streptosporangium sp. NPDC006007 TaxID=3154575 RepID=UPI0033A7D9B7